jgi:predicted AlkP superfamily pyrophosphatase or phosphodiesterase
MVAKIVITSTKTSMKKYSFALLLLCAFSINAQQTDKKLRTLIVIFDGLRPDYITPEFMPNVHALKKKGSYGAANHSVFPTVTRVNASSYATGSYPHTHGLLGNTVYFPEVDKTKGLNTGDARELMRITDATHDKLLTSVSFGELLQKAGTKFMVFSSGSSGQAYLQNHKVSGGAVVNPDLILPESFKEEVVKTIGVAPVHLKPNKAQHEWATNALIHYGLAADGPMVNAIWFSDPDGTAHSDGIGSPTAMESIKIVDHEFGKIVAAIESKDLADSYNIIISTDHGFVTDIGTESLADFLIKQGLKADKQSEDVILAGGAIYVKDHEQEKIKKIVRVLQQQPWIGGIFTSSGKKDKSKGWVEGTLSFETIRWNHERSADILVDYNWDDRKNAFGFAGASFSKGVAGHGGASPYEINIPLIVAGPSFRTGYESMLPTSNVDIVPTILKVHGLDIPKEMEGRVMSELLAGSKSEEKNKVKKETIETSIKSTWGTYHLIVERTVFGQYNYVNYAKVTRESAASTALAE